MSYSSAVRRSSHLRIHIVSLFGIILAVFLPTLMTGCNLASKEASPDTLVISRSVLESSPAMVKFYHQDHNGSVVMTSNFNGMASGKKVHLPYGQELNPKLLSSRGLMGNESDAAIASVNFGVRGYEPTFGKFMAADNLVFGGSVVGAASLNRYAFAGNDPVNNAENGNAWWRNSETGDRKWFENDPNDKNSMERPWQPEQTSGQVTGDKNWDWLNDQRSAHTQVDYGDINTQRNLLGNSSLALVRLAHLIPHKQARNCGFCSLAMAYMACSVKSGFSFQTSSDMARMLELTEGRADFEDLTVRTRMWSLFKNLGYVLQFFPELKKKGTSIRQALLDTVADGVVFILRYSSYGSPFGHYVYGQGTAYGFFIQDVQGIWGSVNQVYVNSLPLLASSASLFAFFPSRSHSNPPATNTVATVNSTQSQTGYSLTIDMPATRLPDWIWDTE